MARRSRVKSASDLDAKLTQTLEKHYRALARYLDSRSFEDVQGLELRKLEIARAALEARTRATASTDDAMRSFLAQMEEEEGRGGGRGQDREALRALDQGDDPAAPAPLGRATVVPFVGGEEEEAEGEGEAEAGLVVDTGEEEEEEDDEPIH